MRDQVAAAARAGIRAVEISSANMTEWDDIAARLSADDVDVLLVSPERLTNPRFREEQLPGLVARCGLVVVDEAHCVSDWGHDFRPDYRRIRDLLGTLPAGTPVLATTATANERVVADVAEQLGAGGVEVTTVRGPLSRDSLRLGVLRLPSDRARLAWLAAHIGDLPGSGIVYTLTVAAAEETAALLRDAGHEVRAYTGRLDDADRKDAEEALRNNEVKALVATSALGMGFDKPDLGFVVHLGAPSSPVSYYQQVGRAGRAVEHADVLLLPGPEDLAIWQWFATSSMPREDHAAAVLTAMADGKAWSVARLETVADVRRSRLELLLKVLAVDGAVERVQGGWRSTGQPWVYDADRYARVTRTREAEQRAMIAYARPVDEAECRMAFLQEALDDPTAAPCGRCDVCAGPWYSADVPEAAAEAASAALDRPGVELAPRAQWPTGADRLGVDVKGKIAPAEQMETGPSRGPADRPRAGDSDCAPCSGTTASAGGGRSTSRRPASRRTRTPPSTSRCGAPLSDVPPDDDLLRACARVLGCLGLGGAPGRRRRHPVAPPSPAGHRPGAGARPARAAALPGRDVPAARWADRPARRQQRVPPGRGVGPDRRRPGAAGAAGLCVRSGPAGRRPGRLPLDDDRGRPRTAPRRGQRRAAVRAGAHRLSRWSKGPSTLDPSPARCGESNPRSHPGPAPPRELRRGPHRRAARRAAVPRRDRNPPMGRPRPPATAARGSHRRALEPVDRPGTGPGDAQPLTRGSTAGRSLSCPQVFAHMCENSE